MSEVKYTKENPPIVSRNEVSLPLTLTKFGKTSDRKGQEFFTLEIDAANQEDGRKFMGDSTVNTILTRFLRRVGMDIWVEALDATTGKVDYDEVISAWADFESGAATMGDLQEQIGDLVDQAQTIVMDDKYATDDTTGQPLFPEDYVRLTEQMKAVQKKIKPLKLQYKELETKHLAAAAKRAAAKAEKEKASPSKSTPAPTIVEGHHHHNG